MAKLAPYLFKRKNSNYWQYARHIPASVRHVFGGRVQLTASTKTEKISEANHQADRFNLVFETLVDHARTLRANQAPIFNKKFAELEKIAARIVTEKKHNVDQHLLTSDAPPSVGRLTAEDGKKYLESIRPADLSDVQRDDESTEQAIERLTNDRSAALKRIMTADKALAEFDTKIAIGGHTDIGDTPSTKRSLSSFKYENEILVELINKKIEFLKSGHTASQHNPYLYQVVSDEPQEIDVSSQLGFLATTFLAEFVRSTDPKTIQQKTFRLMLLVEELGEDADVSKITEKDIIKLKNERLPFIPKNPSKIMQDMSGSERINYVKKHNFPTISPKTINLYLDTWSSFFNSNIVKRVNGINPCHKLKIPQSNLELQQRDGFTTEELQAIFKHPIYTGCQGRGVGEWKKPGDKIIKDDRYWIPLLALYTGARVSEICYLCKNDIRQDNSIWIIDVHPANHPGKKLKNNWSQRYIPVHSKLIEIGFIKWVSDQPDTAQFLFQDLHNGCKRPSDTFSKRFSHFLKSSGLKRNTSPTTSFHSFRHSFKEECRIADIHVHYADRIGGWKPQGHNAGAHYGRTDINHLKTAIDKLMFKGLELDHLTS